MANEQTITCGPFGGPGTTATSWDDKTYTTVREVILHAGTEIHSIQLVYDNQGKPVYGQQHGSVGGTLYKVSLAYPGEYLVSISGHFGQCIYNNKKYVVLKSLIFHSNTKQHGPYGPQEGSRFLGPLPIGKIVGFFGKKGGRLDSIGVYVKPFPTRITVGPFGTTGGQQWDDGTYSTVREIIINAGALIDSIQVVYDSEGKPVMGEMHGSKSGNQHRVILDYPDEFLVSFSGYYGQVDKMIIIRSLGFQSNKRTFGPFGTEDVEKFQFSYGTCGKIIGFHGRSDKYLTSIGAYLVN